MRLCKSELSIKFDAKVNNVRGETVDVILTVFNGYDPVKGKYLFSIYLYIQKENGTNEFLCGSISYIDNHENLNIYNTEKEVITVKKAIGYIMPYCLLMAVCWLLIIIGWYLLGAPIGIGVSPTL